MLILDKIQIGNTVQVNLELSKDRLNKEVIDAINTSSIGTVKEFRITDGKGIGVILKLCNGKEQWFFENEINILDENGNVIKNEIMENENNNIISGIFNSIEYENKKEITDLLNPINFFVWLIVSFKDVL